MSQLFACAEWLIDAIASLDLTKFQCAVLGGATIAAFLEIQSGWLAVFVGLSLLCVTVSLARKTN